MPIPNPATSVYNRLCVLSHIMETFSFHNIDEKDIPPEMKTFLANYPAKDAYKEERQVYDNHQNYTLEELNDFINRIPSSWIRAKLMDIVEEREKDGRNKSSETD